MSKWFGQVGYALPDQVETAPGVWEDVTIEKNYYGEVLNNSRYFRAGENLNNDISVTNRISIVADAYAFTEDHFFDIRYIRWAGKDWDVSSVDATNPPRLILTLGGVYNGPKPSSPPDSSGDVDGEHP